MAFCIIFWEISYAQSGVIPTGIAQGRNTMVFLFLFSYCPRVISLDLYVCRPRHTSVVDGFFFGRRPASHFGLVFPVLQSDACLHIIRGLMYLPTSTFESNLEYRFSRNFHLNTSIVHPLLSDLSLVRFFSILIYQIVHRRARHLPTTIAHASNIAAKPRPA